MSSIDFDKLLEQSIEELRVKTEAHKGVWRLGQSESWSLDQDRGDLIFSFSDGVVASCPAQIIGTYNSQDRTWMWSWHNPSIVDSLKVDALRVRLYGEEHAIDRLTIASWPCEEEDAWSMAAFACKLCEAQGAYRGPAGSAYVFMTFGLVELSNAQYGS